MLKDSLKNDADWEIVKKDGSSSEPRTDAMTGKVLASGSEAKMKDFDDRQEANREVTRDQVARYRQAFESDPSAKVAQNACQSHSIHKLTLRRDLIQTNDFTFNNTLESMPVTDQMDSGRCWMFATLNLFRYAAVDKLQVENFEFSEAYLFFWDKLEKANCFLEAILGTAHRPLDDHTLSTVLEDPIGDGNDWTPAISLIAKYGLVPKSAFPESYTSSSTDNMNNVLNYLLACSAQEIRAILNGSNNQNDDDSSSTSSAMEDARKHKDSRMDDVYRILCVHLGTPPDHFDWQWRDEDGNFHRQGVITPLEFADQIVDQDKVPWKSYVCLIQDPRHEYYQPYTVEYSQTVLGGFDIVFLNVPIHEMKLINQKLLQDGRPVYFACNVGQEYVDKPGLWDAQLYGIESFYGVKNFGISKAEKIRFGYPMGTHAMLMTGIDIQEGKPEVESGELLGR